MKTNQKYTLLSVVTTLAVVGSTFGTMAFAQAVTPLTCSVAPVSVNANQAAIFTAVGGNGSYVWSGQNLNVSNATGNRFAVSYPNAGVYAITVSSAGLSATCSMSVVASTSTGGVSCTPGMQNVVLGQVATFAATGGNGNYVWSSPDLTIANVTGSGFSANYATAGLKTMTVTSATTTDTCAVNVLMGTVVVPPVVPVFPNTGGGYNK